MAYGYTMTLDGEQVEATLPQDVRDVLDWRTLIAPRLAAAYTDDVGHVLPTWWAAQWLADHLHGWDAEEVDLRLTPAEVMGAGEELIRIVSTPHEVALEIREHAEVLGEGGCGCPACKEGKLRDDWKPATRQAVESVCKYKGLSTHAELLIGTVLGLEGVDWLGAPWQVYHAREQYQIGYAMGVNRKTEREKRKAAFNQALEEAGVKRPRKHR